MSNKSEIVVSCATFYHYHTITIEYPSKNVWIRV